MLKNGHFGAGGDGKNGKPGPELFGRVRKGSISFQLSRKNFEVVFFENNKKRIPRIFFLL